MEIKKKHGYLMMVVLWLGYISFAMNWVAGSTLSPEILQDFFGTTKVDPVISQVVNYSITTARIFANIFAALILIRLGPKWSGITALALLMMALVAVWMPGYWYYTLVRMLMGLGGSMIVVYFNTVTYQYFSDPKEKLRINAINILTYNVGAFIVSLVFTYFADVLTKDWRLTMTVISSVTVVLFICWLIVAKNFEVNTSQSGQQVEYAYGQAIRDPFLWRYALGFSGFLTLYILALVSLNTVFDKYTLINGSAINLCVSGAGIVGTFAGLKIGNLGRPRKPTLLISGVIMIGSFIGVVYFANISPWVSYSLAIISGFFMYVQYPIYMNLAHEMEGMSPQKLTLLFGLFWALAYIVQTALTITWSYILGHSGYVSSMVFFLASTCLYLIFTATLPETRVAIKNTGKSKVIA